MSLKDKVNNLPFEPGVYIMKDYKGKILYIGKAKELRKRVQSYFRKQEVGKTKQLVSKIADLEVIITTTELDALILESNLIKKHRPFYNLDLKDDKKYPYLKLTINEEYPRLLIVRQYKEDGARYFGPFAGKGTILRALKLVRTTFPLRQCSGKLPDKACLQLQIKRCLGPCIKKEVKEEYGQAVLDLIDFIEGKYEDLLSRLTHKMKEASIKKQFELAAIYRDRINKIEKIGEHQEVVLLDSADQDIVVFYKMGKEEGLDVLKVRGGKVLGNEVVFFSRNEEENVFARALMDYYERKEALPQKIVLEKPLTDFPMVEEWLSAFKEQSVKLIFDPENELIKMAKRNIEFLKIQNIREEAVAEEALEELQSYLDLTYLPSFIEGYDISNTGGVNIIGSHVVFRDGAPSKKDYRHYNIKTVKGKPDDFASMREMLERRVKKIGAGMLPELILIDGGRGQLGIAESVLKNAGLDIPSISIAKENEDIFYKGKIVKIPKDSKAQKLLQRIRDEAHRFGITFHRKKRKKTSFSSPLDKIPGLGASSKKSLLEGFSNIAAIKKASLAALKQVVSAKLAQKIYNYFHGGK